MTESLRFELRPAIIDKILRTHVNQEDHQLIDVVMVGPRPMEGYIGWEYVRYIVRALPVVKNRIQWGTYLQQFKRADGGLRIRSLFDPENLLLEWERYKLLPLHVEASWNEGLVEHFGPKFIKEAIAEKINRARHPVYLPVGYKDVRFESFKDSFNAEVIVRRNSHIDPEPVGACDPDMLG